MFVTRKRSSNKRGFAHVLNFPNFLISQTHIQPTTPTRATNHLSKRNRHLPPNQHSPPPTSSTFVQAQHRKDQRTPPSPVPHLPPSHQKNRHPQQQQRSPIYSQYKANSQPPFPPHILCYLRPNVKNVPINTLPPLLYPMRAPTPCMRHPHKPSA